MLKVKVEMDGNFFRTSKCDSQETRIQSDKHSSEEILLVVLRFSLFFLCLFA
jgi:hypothetical protein